MATEGAERFGLAQLHQLRGRVVAPNSRRAVFDDRYGRESLERLGIVARINDGFQPSRRI